MTFRHHRHQLRSCQTIHATKCLPIHWDFYLSIQQQQSLSRRHHHHHHRSNLHTARRRWHLSTKVGSLLPLIHGLVWVPSLDPKRHKRYYRSIVICSVRWPVARRIV